MLLDMNKLLEFSGVRQSKDANDSKLPASPKPEARGASAR
jgi:hypothetical protein